MDEDAQALDRIARRETQDRVENIVSAWRERPATPEWREVYRHAHTLAGIADAVAEDVADAARDLAMRLRDERGHFVELSEEDRRHVDDDVERMAAWLRDATASPFAAASADQSGAARDDRSAAATPARGAGAALSGKRDVPPAGRDPPV